MPEVTLRQVQESDLPSFFAWQNDAIAYWQAAFSVPDPADMEAFTRRWQRILADPANTNRTILLDNQVVGHIACYPMFDEWHIGYEIDRAWWGRGIASAALDQLLQIITRRPLFARAAYDNKPSLRVLEKNGFVRVGSEMAYAEARNQEIEEIILRLD